MGRHSLSYRAALQEDSTAASTRRGVVEHVGRVGLLAVALGIGAAVAGGTAVAQADTSASTSSDDSAATSSTDSPTTKRNSTRPSAVTERDANDTSADDDPGSAPRSSLDGVRRTPSSTDRDNSRADDVEADDEVVSAAIDPEVPSPDDEVATEYGDIGKWMLEPNGDIADYGALPYEGRTVLEAINVVIVDPTSRSSLEATWRLNAAMRRAGFPPRLIHSTGFRGLIDGERYRQQPRGLLVGYSDDFFLLPNNHGRIFGPDPVETSTGYVWSGSFSTEEFVFYQGLPRHAYVSSEEARSALASGLVASGRATLNGTVSLDNSYNTDTTTTGDHDGYAVVITLNNLRTTRAVTPATEGANSGSESCLAAGFAALSPCVTRS